MAQGIGLFYTIFLARFLGVENFGIYTFSLAFIYNFIPAVDFGIERLVLRDIPRSPEKTNFYLSRLLPLRFLLWLGTYVILLVLGFILGRPQQEIFYLAILGLGLLPYSFVYLMASFKNAFEKMEYMALANFSILGLTAAVGVLFVAAKLSLGWIMLAYVLGNLLVALFFFSRLSKWKLSFGWTIDRKFWQEILAQSWVFALLTILSVFYLRTSVLLVGLMKGAYLTGIYGSAFKFIESIIFIPQALALALFPLSSRLFLEDKEKLKSVYKKTLVVLFLFSLPFALVLIFFSKFLIGLPYGQSYAEAIPVLSVLGLALILFFLNALPGNVILNSTKVKQFLPVVFLYFLIEIGLCLILIPRYSVLGAAWAVVGGEAFGLIVNNLFVWRILHE